MLIDQLSFKSNCRFKPITKTMLTHGSLLRRAMEYYEQGCIKPIAPIKEFQAVDVEAAMRYMQKGQHIGKIVITFPENPTELEATTKTRDLVLRPDVSYLCIGGLGGLGRSIASWLVERGARHLIFLSRSAGSVTSEDPYIKELAARGCSVQTFSGSVASGRDVKRVVAWAARPIAGVLQASMVLDVSDQLHSLHADHLTSCS